MAAARKAAKSTPLGEWIAGAIGLLLTLAILGHVGWQAMNAAEQVPPDIVVEAKSVSRSGPGYLLEFSARNLSPTAAATVEIEATLDRGGSSVAAATATLDFVPGHSQRGGGLYFDRDPRLYRVQLRALGYAEP